MLRYKLLIGAIIALIPGYSGYWYVIAGKIEAATDKFTAEAADEGINLQFAAKSVSGYPYRLILDYDQPRLAGNTWTWQTPRVEAFAQPYDLTRFIISAPGPHLMEFNPPGGIPVKLSLEAESARASLDYTAGSRMKQIDIDFQTLNFSDLVAGSTLQAKRVQAHLRPSPENPETPGPALDLAIKGEMITLPEELTALLLDAPVTLVQLVATLRGIGDIEALEFLPDMLRAGQDIRLELTKIDLVWGGLTVTARGDLTLDDQNRLTGALHLTIIGHEEILDRLEKAGLLKPAVAGLARSTLGSIASVNNGRAVITIALNNGVASAGFLRLATLKPLF